MTVLEWVGVAGLAIVALDVLGVAWLVWRDWRERHRPRPSRSADVVPLHVVPRRRDHGPAA